ncbi:uncharacterized protein LOC133806836 [Humulus lupulus]|uniref:uncharacterized protein LOC133806836 n=1 Tax=Humulus lupulus TaxID=3486 RepID=UPI002B41253D|nr:uncharacterized protein LOC133806836 [Humulus lupulus]
MGPEKSFCLFRAFTCHKLHASSSWYFDSGCSRHMTGNASILTNFTSLKCGVVTFGDGMTGNILEKGTLNVDGLPKVKKVLLVDGMKANLIYIGQIYDQRFVVNFSHDECNVVNQNGDIILKGSGCLDNCYPLMQKFTCHASSPSVNNTNLWHEKLGHINLKFWKSIVDKFLIRGILKLDKESAVEKDCNIGKIIRTRSDHGKEFKNSVDRENLGKFDAKSDLGVFLGYLNNSKAYRVYNMRTQYVMESADVVVDDLKDFSKYSCEEEIDRFLDAQHQTEKTNSTEGHCVATTSENVLTETESVATTSRQSEKETPIIISDSVQREPST